jgi:hypothetical protein
LFFDWDETISSHDTLAQIAPPEGTHPGAPFLSYSEAYMADLASHKSQHESLDKQISIVAQLEFLQSLDEVELNSQKRIEQGGLFIGFDQVAMEERGRSQVRLRSGFKEMMAREHIRSLEHHIISVGWSARFISAALKGSTSPASICANEIEIDQRTGIGTGRLTKSNDAGASEGRYGIRIAQHKVREMKRILAAKERGEVLTVFAGDSGTDFAALLEADVGLILGENKSLRDTLTRLGLDSHLSKSVEEWKERRRTSKEPSKPDLVFVGDWFKGTEVIEALLGECK